MGIYRMWSPSGYLKSFVLSFLFFLFFFLFFFSIFFYCGLLSFDVVHNVYKEIKSGNEWHARVDRRGFGTKQDFIPLFFFMHVQILWQGQNAVLRIVKFELCDIFYSKFQLISTFSICSKFCVENCLLCCDLICKWVTCRSGCKSFGNQLFKYWLNFRRFSMTLRYLLLIESKEEQDQQGYHDINKYWLNFRRFSMARWLK